MSSGIVHATRLRSGGSLAFSARPGRVALARESARSVGLSVGRVRVRRSFSLLGCSVCVCTLASLCYKKIVDTIASSLCYAPTVLPSCRRDGQRGGAKPTADSVPTEPRIFYRVGLRPIAIRLGCVCSSATRTRLFWPIRAMHSAGSAHVIESPLLSSECSAGFATVCSGFRWISWEVGKSSNELMCSFR